MWTQTKTLKPRGDLRKTDLWVWIAFLLLNAALSLPYFAFNRTDWRFIPVPLLDVNSLGTLFISREHVDLLGLNAEVCLAFSVWVVLAPKWGRKARIRFWGFFLAAYLLALGYQTYANALTGLYQMAPNFYNDYSFLAGGLPYFLHAMDFPAWIYPSIVLGLTAFVVLLWRGTRWILVDLPELGLGLGTRGLLAGIGVLVLIYGWRFGDQWAQPGMGISSLGAAVAENVRASLESRQGVRDFDLTSPFRSYDYAQYSLVEKPDIYLIFMESYGSVLYTKDHFWEPYLDFLERFEDQIESEGWQSVSIFSESPTWGGGTWIAYTAAMFGLPVQEQSQYAAMHQAYQQVPYPNLGRYLQTQGYQYIWVAPNQRRISRQREQADENFFGVERWVRLEDMDYQGPLFGWGPSPPDQFTFGYMGEFVQEQDQPTFLVFLTQNSHYPYTPLPPLLADWRTFAKMDPEEGVLRRGVQGERIFRETRQHYIDAMAYTFESLVELLSKLEDREAIVVLMGDHQPPAISYKGDGYATMLHILSRDGEFLKGFEAYGFSPGLALSQPEGLKANAGMVHAGFYSLFVRNLVSKYGEAGRDLPAYLPDGLGE